MSPELRFEFIVDQPNSTLTVKREFAGPRQLVWDCHTRAELLDRWYAPKPLTAKTTHMDFREGGHWHFAMIMPNGQAFWSRMGYEKIDPIDGYRALDGFTDETGVVNPDMPRSRQDVRFTDAQDRTLVTTVIQYNSPDDIQKVLDMGMQEGLTSTLERLDELLREIGPRG
jgi:uncharacterized protein YndB with AHSA1/START domain